MIIVFNSYHFCDFLGCTVENGKKIYVMISACKSEHSEMWSERSTKLLGSRFRLPPVIQLDLIQLQLLIHDITFTIAASSVKLAASG